MNLISTGEFGIIDQFAKPLQLPIENIITGIGDDCAVIRAPLGKHLLVTSDMLIEQVHFDRRYIQASDLGHKALAASLSDIAAMGGRALCYFVSVGFPGETRVDWVRDFFAGMGRLGRAFNISLAGGDTVSSPVVTIDVTVIGHGEPQRIVRRSGAKPGDLIMVTGCPGLSAAGLALLKNGPDRGNIPPALVSAASRAIEEHRLPQPRLREAAALVADTMPHSMMDLSDSLIGDLRHILNSSRVGAEIWLGSLPQSEGFTELAGWLGVSPDDLSLYGGEDYELLFTVAEEHVESLTRAVHYTSGTRPAVIGRITAEPQVTLTDRSGRHVAAGSGFDHFRNLPS